MLRRQVYLHRYTVGEVKAILALLEEADEELALRIRRMSARVGPGGLSTVRAKEMLTAIRVMRAEAFREVRRRLTSDMRSLATVEATAMVNILRDTIPVNLDLITPPAQTLRALVTSKPFAAHRPGLRTITQAVRDIAASDIRRVESALQLGIVQGETPNQLVRRVIGTRARRYADGLVSIARRDAEAVTRAFVNHVSNAAREEVFQDNDDIILGVRIVATLDGKTGPVCRDADGRVDVIGKHKLPRGERALVPAGVRPPLHAWGCRSAAISILSWEGISDRVGVRPFVRDTRDRTERERDFRAEAKDAAGDKWKGMNRSARNAATRSRRDIWVREAVGTVPAKTEYRDWFERQPMHFQREVLGPTKYALYREGGVTLDRFVDRGKPLTLAQLAEREPEAFRKAGL
jgi:hypothetical protein